MRPFLLLTMEQEHTRQEVQEWVCERSRKSHSSANEQRCWPIAAIAEQGNIVPNPFGRQGS